MYKFFIVAGSALLFSTALFAQSLPSSVYPETPLSKETLRFRLQSQLEQAAAKQRSNKNAVNNHFRIFFHIKETLFHTKRNKDVGTYEGYLLCKAYALDEHWLILPSSCMDYLHSDLPLRELPANWVRRNIKITGISDFAAPLNTTRRNQRIMLIRTDKKQKGPYVNILASGSAQILSDMAAAEGRALKIHTDRLGTDTVKARSINKQSVQNNTFELKEQIFDLSGVARDPLFLITRDGNEFLAGYNNGAFKGGFNRLRYDIDLIRVYNGRASAEWYSLTEEDLLFIKDEVSRTNAADWRRIQKRLFFNQTNRPYFEE